MKRKACGRTILKGAGRHIPDAYTEPKCGYERAPGLQQCRWHWLLKQPADVQKMWALNRLARDRSPQMRARVPAAEWPEGERWCAGCQSFVPLFYTSGSRCKSCASNASHEQRVQKTYGLEPGEYDALFRLQGGRCFICQRKSPSRRLAVDHDHVTGAVRGLLCPDPERGCNHAILGPLEASPGGALAAARRMVLYLELTPYERIQNGIRKEGRTTTSWRDYCASEVARIDTEAASAAARGALDPFAVTPDRPPPF